jgi:hypothetical protein
MFEDRGAFQMFDPGAFNTDNLRYAAQNNPAPLNQAAQYLLDHPDLLAKLQAMSGGQGQVSKAALSQYIQMMTTPPAQNGTTTSTSTGGATGSTTGSTQGSNTNTNCTQGSTSSSNTGNTSSSVSSSSSGPSSNPYYGLNKMTYQDVERECDNLMNKQNLTDDEYKRLQALMQQRQEMFQMMSNIQTMLHDMAMTAINNMKG